MFKKLRKKVFIAAFSMIAATGVCIPSMADENQLRAGTERNFSGTLPEGHGNKYYTTRTRQTNMNGGYALDNEYKDVDDQEYINLRKEIIEGY